MSLFILRSDLDGCGARLLCGQNPSSPIAKLQLWHRILYPGNRTPAFSNFRYTPYPFNTLRSFAPSPFTWSMQRNTKSSTPQHSHFDPYKINNRILCLRWPLISFRFRSLSALRNASRSLSFWRLVQTNLSALRHALHQEVLPSGTHSLLPNFSNGFSVPHFVQILDSFSTLLI